MMRNFLSTLWAAIVDYLQGVDPGMVRAIIFKVVRWALGLAGGALETHGLLKGSQLEQFLAAAPMVASILLSIYDAYIVKQKISNAAIAGRAETGTPKDKTVAVAALKETSTS